MGKLPDTNTPSEADVNGYFKKKKGLSLKDIRIKHCLTDYMTLNTLPISTYYLRFIPISL